MSQFVSTSRYCRDIHYKSTLQWDIAETMLKTLTLELSSSARRNSQSSLESVTTIKQTLSGIALHCICDAFCFLDNIW